MYKQNIIIEYTKHFIKIIRLMQYVQVTHEMYKKLVWLITSYYLMDTSTN